MRSVGSTNDSQNLRVNLIDSTSAPNNHRVDRLGRSFIVGDFLVKRARLLQWLVFFRQTTDLIVYVPLFTENTRNTQAKPG